MKRGNIVSGFGEDKLVLSYSFVQKYADIIEAEDKDSDSLLNEVIDVAVEIVENSDNYTKEGIIDKLTNYLEKYDAMEKEGMEGMGDDVHKLHTDIISKFKDSLGSILEAEETIEKEEILTILKETLEAVETICEGEAEEVVDENYVASKKELTKRGFTSVGTGLYKSSDHHLWKLKREGEGYNISRVSDEEELLKEEKVASKTAHTVTVESDTSLSTFFDNLNQSGVYYTKISGGDNSATIDVDDADIDMFNSVLGDSDVRTAGIASEGSGIEESDKVFSDEAIITGISHYTNMGHDEKDAIKYFIDSNELDKKEYESRIKDILEKY